ncbi:hypothetical protein A9995_07115 [Erythrobacter sp. QSSC1-22B]|nr:hypothetical protein A9995_07115 [Erythrobacter sp. QSSC1-22B]
MPLLGISDDEAKLFPYFVHVRATGEIIGGLRAAMKHYNERKRSIDLRGHIQQVIKAATGSVVAMPLHSLCCAVPRPVAFALAHNRLRFGKSTHLFTKIDGPRRHQTWLRFDEVRSAQRALD